MDFLNPTFAQTIVFLLVFARVIGMISLLPLLGSQTIPVAIKIGIAIVLSVSTVPSVAPATMPHGLAEFFLLAGKEALIGIVIGYAASLLFSAVQFAGALIDTLMGFGFVELVDPFTESSTTTLGQLNTLVFTMVFIVIGGHYYMILAIHRSFEIIPLFGMHYPAGAMLKAITGIAVGVFDSALKLAAPAFVTLIICSLALGVVARTVPQMNVYFVGLPLTIGLGFGTTIVVYPYLATVFGKLFNAMLNDVWRLMFLMA
jgi:flagellar biosynthesis protein FliR